MQTERTVGTQRQILDRARQSVWNRGWTNVLRATALLQDLLHLAIFPKRSVHTDKCQSNVVGQFEIRVFDIHFQDFSA